MSDDDLEILRGAAAIAKAAGMKNRRQAYWLLENGRLPADKEGSIWVTTKKRLRQHYNGEQAA